MKPRLIAPSLGALLLIGALVVVSVAGAQVPGKTTADKALSLEAEGGVTAKVPDWKQTRSGKSVAVLEHVATKGGGFALLVLAIEAGPTGEGEVDWNRIRDNIVAAAGKGGSELTLSVGDDVSDAAGFSGKRLQGRLKAKKHEMAVEMVALVGSGKLVTITVLTPEDDKGAGPLALAVAGTVEAAPKAP